ncbi:MAG: hypothetical protein SGBAC_000190 [Bacillariaceae sp.]
MQRGNLFFSICAGIFGAVLLVQLVRHDAGSPIESQLRGQQQRELYSNYLWQRDDDDDYFSNSNSTGYFSNNQNYKAQGNGQYSGGSYVNGYSGNSNNTDDDDQATSSQLDDDSIKKSSSASSVAFGGLSPAKSAILGIFIGLLLIVMIACCLYGPTVWALFSDWLFNRSKNGPVEHDFENMS